MDGSAAVAWLLAQSARNKEHNETRIALVVGVTGELESDVPMRLVFRMPVCAVLTS